MSNKRVSFLRQAGWISPDMIQDTLMILGCGAAGSNVALLAAKMGCTRFDLWDADIVEPHNLSNQAFDIEHLDQPKVEALAQVLKRFNPEIEVTVHDEFFTKENASFPGGPVILTVDKMAARKEILELTQNNLDVTQVFEIRLGFDFGIVNIIDNLDDDSVKNFAATIKNDDEIEEGPCNQRMCTTLVWNTASLLVHQLSRFYVADHSGDDFVAPYRYFVTLDNKTGLVDVTPLGTNEWEDLVEGEDAPDQTTPETTTDA